MDRKKDRKMKDKGNRFGLRRIGVALLLLLLPAALQGCALARKDLQETAWQQERICGVLVTVGDQRSQLEESVDLEGRTFSSVQEMMEAMTAPVTVEGALTEDGSYMFGGIRGHFFGIFEQEDAQGPYVHFVNDGSFADVKANTHVSDTGIEYEMNAAVLAPPGLREPIYMNPVYQRSDGTVYVSLDGGGFLSGGIDEEDGSVTGGVRDEGEVYAQTFTGKETKRVNGKEEVYSVELTVSCELRYPVRAVRILEMDGENRLLETQVISQEMEQAALHEETAYVIVEEERTDGSLKRSLYEWEQKPEGADGLVHSVYYPGADGLLCPKELLMIREGTS